MKINVISNGKRPRFQKSRPKTSGSSPGKISKSSKINTEQKYSSIKAIRKSNKKMHTSMIKSEMYSPESIAGTKLPPLRKFRKMMKPKTIMANKQNKEKILQRVESETILGNLKPVLKISNNPSMNPYMKRI